MENKNEYLKEISTTIFNTKLEKRLRSADTIISHYTMVVLCLAIWVIPFLLLLFTTGEDLLQQLKIGFLVMTVVALLGLSTFFMHGKFLRKMLRKHPGNYDEDMKGNLFNLRYCIHKQIIITLLGPNITNMKVLDHYYDFYDNKIKELFGYPLAEIRITQFLNIKVAFSIFFLKATIARDKRTRNILNELRGNLDQKGSVGLKLILQ